MIGKTASSSPTEDLAKARAWAFDPAYYEALCGLGTDQNPSGFCSSSASLSFLGQESGTEALKSNAITQMLHETAHLAESINRGQEAISALYPYEILSSLSASKSTMVLCEVSETSVSELIGQLKKQQRIRSGERIANRLEYLLEVSREESPEQAPLAADSLTSFLGFLVENPGLAYPNIVLTFDGNVRAEWTEGTNKHVAIEFCGDDTVRFVIFAPDPRHPYRTSRISGTATTDSVIELAELYALHWMKMTYEQAA